MKGYGGERKTGGKNLKKSTHETFFPSTISGALKLTKTTRWNSERQTLCVSFSRRSAELRIAADWLCYSNVFVGPVALGRQLSPGETATVCGGWGCTAGGERGGRGRDGGMQGCEERGGGMTHQ